MPLHNRELSSFWGLTEMCGSDVSGHTNTEKRDHEQLQLLHK